MTFSLSKWYLDCVTSSGDALIAYVAQVRWRTFAIHYASLLERRAGRARARTSLLRHEVPSAEGPVVAWSSQPLGIEGTWRAVAPAVAETVYASAEGSVRWHCVQPGAVVTLRFGRGDERRTIEGLGYVERLTMSLPPWRLPIDELLWGRFVAPGSAPGAYEAIVWIDWRGRHSARRVFRGGAPVQDADVSAERLVLGDGGVLELAGGDALRTGAIGSTVLSSVPVLARALPARMLGVQERKWCSRATLTSKSGTAVQGWAIHEVVRWPSVRPGR